MMDRRYSGSSKSARSAGSVSIDSSDEAPSASSHAMFLTRLNGGAAVLIRRRHVGPPLERVAPGAWRRGRGAAGNSYSRNASTKRSRRPPAALMACSRVAIGTDNLNRI